MSPDLGQVPTVKVGTVEVHSVKNQLEVAHPCFHYPIGGRSQSFFDLVIGDVLLHSFPVPEIRWMVGQGEVGLSDRH